MKPYLIERWGRREGEVKSMGEIWKTAITDSFNKFLGKGHHIFTQFTGDD